MVRSGAEYKRLWYQKNKDRIKNQHKVYYKQNKKRIIGKQKEYYLAHKKERSAYRKSYYWADREKYIKRSVEWNRNHPEQRRLITKRDNDKNRLRKRHWKERKIFDGNATISEKICELCGSTYRLAVHHRDGKNGKLGKPMNNAPKNLVVLCIKCHSAVHGWWGVKSI